MILTSTRGSDGVKTVRSSAVTAGSGSAYGFSAVASPSRHSRNNGPFVSSPSYVPTVHSVAIGNGGAPPEPTHFDVFGFGNALVDVIVMVDDLHVQEFGLQKGQAHLVPEEKIEEMLMRLEGRERTIVPAGSCANTIFALSALGANVVLCGKVGEDPRGKMYEEIMLKEKITSKLKKSATDKTGTVVNLVTPDGERTFAVNLGAAVTVRKEELRDVTEDLTGAHVFHTEGYVLEDPKLRESALHLMGRAGKAGVQISIDLSDPGIISRNLSEMRAIVEKCANIVFLNEEEAKAFTGGMEPEAAARAIARLCDIVVVKVGAKGSVIAQKGKGEVILVEGVKASAVDTTGAGDFYAAGFLYGLCLRKDLETCGRIGSIVAAKVVEQVGARPPAGLRNIPALEGLL